MTRADAIRKITKLLGPKAYWRVGEHTTSPEKREEAKVCNLDLNFRRASVHRDLQARQRELLDADPEYQRLHAEWRALNAEEHQVSGYKFEAGVREGIFITPRAYGDTWEEVITKLQAQQKAKV